MPVNTSSLFLFANNLFLKDLGDVALLKEKQNEENESQPFLSKQIFRLYIYIFLLFFSVYVIKTICYVLQHCPQGFQVACWLNRTSSIASVRWCCIFSFLFVESNLSSGTERAGVQKTGFLHVLKRNLHKLNF